MYTFRQTAEILGVGRQSIYNYAIRPEMDAYIHNGKRGKLIDEQGIEVLKTLLFPVDVHSTECPKKSPNTVQVSKNDTNGHSMDIPKHIPKESMDIPKVSTECPNLEIEYLKSVIQEKDNQINTLMQLVDQSQRLQLTTQQNMLLLENKKSDSWWNWIRRKY